MTTRSGARVYRRERKTVSFGDAGKVTVTVDVKWLDLADNVFTGLRKVIRDLEALSSSDSSSHDAGEAGTTTEDNTS